MEDSFPEALDKVNAEAALKFAEQGRLNWARLHVEFMRQTHQGRDNVTRTMELVLAPIRAQVSEGNKTARQRLEKDPKQGAQIARQLIEQSSRLSQLYDILHGSDAPYKTELFDEVALAGVDCAVSYQKSTSDDVVFLEVLRAALAFVSGPELRERIQRNIDIGEGNLRWSEIKPLREKLDRIMESKSPASVQFAEVKQQMIPELAMLAEREGVHPDLINEFSDTLGYALRALSITAHNDDDDFETAVAASRLASALARAPELKKMISDDLVVVQGTLENARKGGISLDLGREKISMSRKSVTYKGKEILVRDVTGVRYGQEALSKGSQITGRSYRVDLAGGGTEFLIETHDGFRSDESASNAYSKLVDGVYDNVVPRLLKNLSQGVMDGRPYQMGPVKIVTEGVYLAASAGEGPGHFIPWSDLRFGSRDGKLSVRSDSDPRLQVSLRLREVWNAVLFEPLINAVIEKRKKAIKST